MSLRALKILVGVLGVLLVGGFAALVVAIAHRVANRQPAPPAAATLTAPPFELPAGARIETIAVGSDRLVLHLVLADGGRELAIVDLATGRRINTIPLRIPQ